MGYTNRNYPRSLCLIVYDGLLQVAFCMMLRNSFATFSHDLKWGVLSCSAGKIQSPKDSQKVMLW